MLPPSDKQYLDQRAPGHVVTAEANMICVTIPEFTLPAGLSTRSSTLLLRLSPGYPDVPPDMWWFNPPVKRLDGVEIAATQAYERHLGREWQRWSRHLSPGQWRSGVDSLESYLAIVRRELEAAAPRAAA
jgi:hypothetical protein